VFTIASTTDDLLNVERQRIAKMVEEFDDFDYGFNPHDRCGADVVLVQKSIKRLADLIRSQQESSPGVDAEQNK
jgi:hypothetical protein